MKPFSHSADPTRRHWLKAATLLSAASACPWPRAVAAAPASTTAPSSSETQWQGVRQLIQEAIARKALPGASLVILSRGQVVLREAYGRTDFDSDRPYSVDAPCVMASVSKPVTATYFTILDERGVISLDDPVEKFLPEFKGIQLKATGQPATTTLRVWHLLSHRSGFPGNADLGDARPQRLARAADAAGAETAALPEGFSLAEVVSRWVREGLRAEPGARFAYGSSGYMVAARIAEVVLGRRFERLLQEGLLDPLRMTRTTFHPDVATIARLPARYASTPQGLQRDARTMPLPKPDGLINPAGGLISRLDDMAAFMALHLNRGLSDGKRLAQAKSLARMYRPHPPRATETAEGGGQGYGLGWNVLRAGEAVRHLGASGTLAWLDLKRQHAGVFLTQVKWGPGNRPLIPRLIAAVQSAFPNE